MVAIPDAVSRDQELLRTACVLLDEQNKLLVTIRDRLTAQEAPTEAVPASTAGPAPVKLTEPPGKANTSAATTPLGRTPRKGHRHGN